MTTRALRQFSVYLSGDIAERFEAAATEAGGHSALLRRLISAALDGAPRPAFGPVDPRRVWFKVGLTRQDAAEADTEAKAMGLRRGEWVAALVRRRLRGRPTFHRPDELSLFAVQLELRRIAVGISQIIWALDIAAVEGRAAELDLACLADMRAEVRAHMRAVREAFEGNLAYWEAGS